MMQAVGSGGASAGAFRRNCAAGAPERRMTRKQERLLHRLLAAAHATDVVAAFVTKICTFYKNIKSIFAHYPLAKQVTKW